MTFREKNEVFRVRLPATSANLGAGFDAAAVALDLYLEIEAEPAEEFCIVATGRDRERCSRLENNLILDVYRRILNENDRPVQPLAIRMANDIPLGMGCGSSAAGRLAAIALANHFGDLGWSDEKLLEETCAREGHPDNAAACWFGGFVAAATRGHAVQMARVVPPQHWRAIIVLPPESLATTKARAVLPATYSREDVVANIQAVSMLGLAFAQARGDLLQIAMTDRIHQPYRASICPMLPRLLPLAGSHGILGVALSGAGPAMLAVIGNQADVGRASASICCALEGLLQPELLVCRFETAGASQNLAHGAKVDH